MSQDKFGIQAKAVVPRRAFEELKVESALASQEEKVISKDDEEVTIQIYRYVDAIDETEARSKAKDGNLLKNTPHTVTEIMKTRNVDQPL